MSQGLLPPIPVIDVLPAKEPALASLAAEPARFDLLLRQARRSYTPLGIRIADARSRRWSARSSSPYAAIVRHVDQAMSARGAFLLNYSYEWGCTAAAADDPRLGGATLLRTLDWPFDGLGRALVVTRQDSAAGRYLSITWPGFVGVLTGLAPGRFAAAINQPPLPLPRWGRGAGWLAARIRVNRSEALPPSHLLRLAFEQCRSFAEAVALLRRTPICLPAIFTLAGPESGEAAVIEWTQEAAFEPTAPVAANHWAAEGGPSGRPRNESSHARRAAMDALRTASPAWSLDWLGPPILQPDTRLAVMANPRSGRILVQGWETAGAATAALDLE